MVNFYFNVDVTLDGNAEERQSGVTSWKHVKFGKQRANFVKTGAFNQQYIMQYARCPHIVVKENNKVRTTHIMRRNYKKLLLLSVVENQLDKLQSR